MPINKRQPHIPTHRKGAPIRRVFSSAGAPGGPLMMRLLQHPGRDRISSERISNKTPQTTESLIGRQIMMLLLLLLLLLLTMLLMLLLLLVIGQ